MADFDRLLMPVHLLVTPPGHRLRVRRNFRIVVLVSQVVGVIAEVTGVGVGMNHPD